jgi:hypothetical protein
LLLNKKCVIPYNIIVKVLNNNLKNKLKYLTLPFLMVFIFACNTENSTKTTLISDTVDSNLTNSTQFVETTIEEDLLTNEDLTEQLKPIKENVKRINLISNWTSIETK